MGQSPVACLGVFVFWDNVFGVFEILNGVFGILVHVYIIHN